MIFSIRLACLGCVILWYIWYTYNGLYVSKCIYTYYYCKSLSSRSCMLKVQFSIMAKENIYLLFLLACTNQVQLTYSRFQVTLAVWHRSRPMWKQSILPHIGQMFWNPRSSLSLVTYVTPSTAYLHTRVFRVIMNLDDLVTFR